MKISSLIFTVLLCLGNTVVYAEKQDDSNRIFETVSKSIYQIYAIAKDKHSIVSLGNAVAISDKYLATNCHVALSGNFLILKVNDEPYLARLCYFNQVDDLCIVDVVGVTLHPVKIRNSSDVKAGEKVFALAGIHTKPNDISQGIITKIVKHGKYVMLQTNAHMQPGFSGGGLFDIDGNLIGITTSGIPETDIGYAIPTELIIEVAGPSQHPACSIPKNE